MKSIALMLVLILALGTPASGEELRVVTTTEDLAALAREMGGSRVEVYSIARGYQDPHFVDVKPSYLLKLKRADLFIQVGLELEVSWAPALLTNARNSKILPGEAGYVDASRGCDILQASPGSVDRSAGDIHPMGNPHYWLDPGNGRIIAANIARALSAVDPAGAGTYEGNLRSFEHDLDLAEARWDSLGETLRGVKVITYHNTWPNFARRFGLEVVDFVEPKPGVPPSPVHVKGLIERIRAERIPLLLVEPYFDLKLPQKIVRDTETRLVSLPPSVDPDEGIKTYIDLFDHNLKLLVSAVEGT